MTKFLFFYFFYNIYISRKKRKLGKSKFIWYPLFYYLRTFKNFASWREAPAHGEKGKTISTINTMLSSVVQYWRQEIQETQIYWLSKKYKELSLLSFLYFFLYRPEWIKQRAIIKKLRGFAWGADEKTFMVNSWSFVGIHVIRACGKRGKTENLE